MPYPQNLHTAKEVEAIIRENGTIPATIAILDGVPCIGKLCGVKFYFVDVVYSLIVTFLIFLLYCLCKENNRYMYIHLDGIGLCILHERRPWSIKNIFKIYSDYCILLRLCVVINLI